MNRDYMFSISKKVAEISLWLQVVLLGIEVFFSLPGEPVNMIRLVLIGGFILTSLALPWIRNSRVLLKSLGLIGIILVVGGIILPGMSILLGVAIFIGVFFLFKGDFLEESEDEKVLNTNARKDPFPLPGPADRAGNVISLMKYYLSSILAIFNPFQLKQMILHGIGNILVSEQKDFEQKGKYTLPFTGEWIVVNGGSEKKDSHSWDVKNQRFAYDFVVADENNARHGNRGEELEDYYCYGKNILSPGDGKVVEVRDGVRDHPQPGSMMLDFLAKDFRGNFIIIKHEENEYSFMAHFIPGSISVKKGDVVTRGQFMGKCGNSGHSTEPHLHFHFQDHRNFYRGRGLPIRFSNVMINGEYRKESFLTKGERVWDASSRDRGTF